MFFAARLLADERLIDFPWAARQSKSVRLLPRAPITASMAEEPRVFSAASRPFWQSGQARAEKIRHRVVAPYVGTLSATPQSGRLLHLHGFHIRVPFADTPCLCAGSRVFQSCPPFNCSTVFNFGL